MARKIKVDFTGVESFVKCEEGQHVAKLIAIEEKVSSNGNDMLEAKFQITRGNSEGATLFENFVTSGKALFKLKGFLEVIGKKADGKLMIDIDNLIGAVCIIDVAHEEYNGAQKAKIQGYKKLVSPTVETDSDEEFEDEEEVVVPPTKKAPVKEEKSVGKPVKVAPVVVVEEDDDFEEEDEEAPATPPVKKNTKPAPVPNVVAKPAKPAKPAPAVVEADDDDEWDED